MGLEEIFTFVIVGCLAIYYQRSRQQSTTQPPIIFSWLLLIGLPCLAIAWVITFQTSLPLMLTMIGFLLCVWTYGNWEPPAINSESNGEILPFTQSFTQSEEQQLKNCFPPAIYQLRELEYRPSEIYCRGSLRSLNYKYAYDTVNQNIQKIFGDRFICYLQETPTENRGSEFGQSQNSQEPSKYAFYLLPSRPQFVTDPNINYWAIWAITLIITALSLLLVGSVIHDSSPEINLAHLQNGLPYLFGVSSVFIVNAIARFFIAKKYRLPFNLPLLLPAFGGLGMLGGLNIQPSALKHSQQNYPQKNYPQQRQVLFDLAAFPNLASLSMSVILLILGHWLLIPTDVNTAALPSIFLPSLINFEFSNSIFVNFIHTILQVISAYPPSQTYVIDNLEVSLVLLSPLTLAGWTGLAMTALQLLPFEFLDGGCLALAMFGYRQATQLARITRVVLLAIAMLIQPWLRLYSLLLFAIPTPRPLVKNEGLQIGKRDILGLILMAIALLIILPTPKSIVLR